MKILIACEESQEESSKTFSGIAKAMAKQWGNFIKSEKVTATKD